MSVHIVSWNVAGWKTTFLKIRERYGSLESFLELFKIDILCLQEVKLIQSSFLEDKDRFGGASSQYDVFFALANKGANGCATIARKGSTVKANRDLSSEFENSGRYLETDHGSFFLINVYVHNDGGDGGVNVPQKMQFLLKVRKRMRELRKEKPVIFCGDMNLKVSAMDSHWTHNYLLLDKLRDSEAEEEEPKLVSLYRDCLKGDGLQHFKESCSKAKSKKLPSASNLNRAYSYQIMNKEGEEITVPSVRGDGGTNFLKMEEWLFPIASHELIDEYMSKGIKDGQWIGHPKNAMNFSDCCRFMSTFFGVPFVQQEVEDFGRYKKDWFFAGKICSTAFANSLLKEEGMVDAFRHCYPEAKERFTCWNQYTNSRYENLGTRIDYFFVDGVLQSKIESGCSLFGCLCEKEGKECESNNACSNDRFSALRAAHAHNMFKPIPSDGSARAQQPDEAYLPFRGRQTGFIYFPPEYSDHIAVSLLLSIDLPQCNLQTDNSTKKTQPHIQQRSLKDFFSKSSSGSEVLFAEVEKKPVEEDKKKAKQTIKKPSIADFFNKGSAKEPEKKKIKKP